MTNWLDKYEQGGMVLKQKTKDNYGKQSNYNDAKVSTPPGYVGLGYNTKGRNYSPAWGGQFEDGGVLGKRFLQPNDSKLPKGWNPEAKGYSTEYSTTIGKNGEYYLVPGFKRGKLLSDPEKEFNNTGELLGGPFKTIQSAQNFADRRHKYVEQGKPVPAPLKTYDEFAMGGTMPGAVGFMYARTQDPAPSNGKYAKKTKASAQNGTEMKYYQEGLDFKPKSISKNGSVIKDDRGQLAYPGEITEIGSNDITMQGVDYPVLGVSDTGDRKMMYPGKDYKFDGNMVTEYPLAQDGKKFSMKDVKENATSNKYPSAQEMSGGEIGNLLIKSADVITDLMQLGNFVPHPIGQAIGKAGNVAGGWLDAYQAADALDKGNYGDAAINLASVALPMALGSNTFKRNSKYLQKGQPLNFLKGKERVNYIEPFTNVKGMTNKSLMANRALLGTLGAETVYDSKKNGGWLNKYK